MDKHVLEEFENEMLVIERIINGYIAANPALEGLQVDMVRLTKKQAVQVKKANFFSLINKPNACKICKDAEGNEYCYWGPNGCPKF